MEIGLPKNVFTGVLADAIGANAAQSFVFTESALLLKNLQLRKVDAAFIPTPDIIKDAEILVSKNYGISFDSGLSNSYLYFKTKKTRANEVFVSGDASTGDIVLLKSMFNEVYEVDPKIMLITNPIAVPEILLTIGDGNFYNNRFLEGVSFSEMVSEVTGSPFMHYILAAMDESALDEAYELLEGCNDKVYDLLEGDEWSSGISDQTDILLREHLYSLRFRLKADDFHGLDYMLRLPYFHGITDDVCDPIFY